MTTTTKQLVHIEFKTRDGYIGCHVATLAVANGNCSKQEIKRELSTLGFINVVSIRLSK